MIQRMTPRPLTRTLYASLATILGATALFVAVGAIAAMRVWRLKDVSILSLEVVNAWHEVDVYSSDLLLKDASPWGSPVMSVEEFSTKWADKRQAFDASFTQLLASPYMTRLGPGAQEALRIARSTKDHAWQRFEEADAALERLAGSHLAEKLVLNKMLRTFYGMRLSDTIAAEEILLVMELIEALQILDVTSENFVGSLREVRTAVAQFADASVQRTAIGAVSAMLLIVAGAALILASIKRVARVEAERSRYREGSRLVAFQRLIRDGWPWPDESGIDRSLPLLIGAVVPDGYDDLCSRTNAADRNLVFRNIEKATVGAFKEHFAAAEACRVSDSTVVILANVSSTQMEDLDALRDQASAACGTIARGMASRGISVTTAVAEPIDNYEQTGAVHDQYEETVDAIQDRFFTGPGQFHFALDASRRPTKDYMFPEEADRQLADALRLGDLDRVRILCEQLIDSARSFPHPVVRLVVSRIGSTVSTTLHGLKRVCTGDLYRQVSAQLADLTRLETKSEVLERIHSAVEPFVRAMHDKRGRRNGEQVERVLQIIEERAPDPNLSLALIADDVGLSAHHLGRVFKTLVGHSIGQHINDVRLARAAALFDSEPDRSVAEIAESLGIVNRSYFFTLFRRRYGMTPREYRERGNQTSQPA